MQDAYLQIDSKYHLVDGYSPQKLSMFSILTTLKLIMGPHPFDFGSRKKLLAIPRPLITRNCWIGPGGPGTFASPTFSSSSWPSCLQDHLSFLNRRRDPEVEIPPGSRMEKHGREWRLFNCPVIWKILGLDLAPQMGGEIRSSLAPNRSPNITDYFKWSRNSDNYIYIYPP